MPLGLYAGSLMDPELMATVGRLLGDRFGGAWTTQRRGRSVTCIGVVDGGSAEVNTLAPFFPDPGAYEVVPVRYSWQDLVMMTRRLDVLTEQGRPSALLAYGPDSSTNKVRIYLDSPDEQVIDRIAERLPADAVALDLHTKPRGIAAVSPREG
jgi:hypothetical protein